MKKILLILAAIVALTFNSIATEIGYTTGNCDRTTPFSANNTANQGQAIRLSHEKIQLLKGHSISAINAAFGSKNTIDNKVTLFIAESLDSEPIVSQEATITKANDWLSYSLDEPYVITGDESELYIGFKGTLIIASYKMLSADRTADLLPGCCYIYNGTEWLDMSGIGYGAANVRAVVSDIEFTDMCMKRTKFDGYYKSGEQYEFSNQLYNFGTTTVNSFDIEISVNGSEPQIIPYTGLELAPQSVYDFTLPEYTSTSTGDVDLSIKVKNINGADDNDTSDNVQSEPVFFYPANMERWLLVESFTGQDCTKCPSGHTTLHSVLSAVDYPFAEVSHHAGYYPDMFTMAEDWQYTFFYASSSTYAPAVMVNRNALQTATSPVSGISKANVTTLLDNALASKPYASMKLESAFNPDTREVTVNLYIQPHTNMPTDKTVFNVMLVQDGLVAYQSNGGVSYTHNNVFRGTVTDNAWGVLANYTPGYNVEWSKTFTLPATIRSSYWTDETLETKGYTEDMIIWPTVPENMRIVAFVANFNAEDCKLNQIHNCIEVKLGESYTHAAFDESVTGVEGIDANAERNVNVRVENRRIVCDEASSIEVFSINGQHISAKAELPVGIYVARLVVAGKPMAKKVVVK